MCNLKIIYYGKLRYTLYFIVFDKNQGFFDLNIFYCADNVNLVSRCKIFNV